MGINKVQYGNTTLIDLTSDTVTADKLMQGYTAHDRTGALITGTATGSGSGGNVWQDAQGYVHLDDEGTTPITVEPLSVTQNGTYTATTGHAYSPVTVNVSGGGGLEYETGTWTPSENSNYPSIPFSNTHSEPPSLVKISDSGTPIQPASAMVAAWGYYDAFKLTGGGFPSDSTTTAYALIEVVYVSTTGTIGGTRKALAHNSSEIGSDASYPSYYASSLGLTPYTLGTRYFLAGRTYKWIAVWAPTT